MRHMTRLIPSRDRARPGPIGRLARAIVTITALALVISTCAVFALGIGIGVGRRWGAVDRELAAPHVARDYHGPYCAQWHATERVATRAWHMVAGFVSDDQNP